MPFRVYRSGISESWERKTVVTKMMWSRKLRSTDVGALTLPLAHRRMKCFFLGNFEWSQVNHKRTRRTNSFACLKKMTRLDEGITQSCEEMSKRFDKIRGVREETQKKIAKEQLRQMESFDARTLNKEELPRVGEYRAVNAFERK